MTTPPAYDERLWFGPVGWFAVVLAAVSLGAVPAPLDPGLGLVVGAVSLVVASLVVVATTARVRVDGGTLRAGRAEVPVQLLAAPRRLDGPELATELGPALDARSYACLRSWVRTAVRVELRDPQDATPYWIVSTRHPQALVAALLAAGAAPAAPAPTSALADTLAVTDTFVETVAHHRPTDEKHPDGRQDDDGR
ncbi:MAG: DUF3093 domain-containing protein [Cellulomonas sp.]|nr:DUF3093 domain-containing protein [Cellulomonas sp.]